ncbi:5'-nucleotidase SurE [Symmachiella dynata]|nr:5'-nucleotidase SurE [Symmachiella dynata]
MNCYFMNQTPMKLLLTNDDGIHADGLAALERAVRGWGTATVVAPNEPYSGCGHTVNVFRPLLMTEVAPGRLALDGSPADCTRIGATQILPDATWVLSGINEGGNLGIDVYMSGTVAAVREAVLLGKPGIAFSQYHRGIVAIDWAAAEVMARRVLELLAPQPLPPGAYWNVNFPALDDDSAAEPEIVFCPLDTSPHRLEYECREGSYHYVGSYHDRPRQPGHDIDVCFSGQIAVTKVVLEGGE